MSNVVAISLLYSLFFIVIVVMVAVGLTAVASVGVVTPALADTSSGQEAITNAREQAPEQGDCGLAIALLHVAGGGLMCENTIP